MVGSLVRLLVLLCTEQNLRSYALHRRISALHHPRHVCSCRNHGPVNQLPGGNSRHISFATRSNSRELLVPDATTLKANGFAYRGRYTRIYKCYPHGFRNFQKEEPRYRKVVKELGGRIWLYVHSYYIEEVWNIYRYHEYDFLRTKYNARYVPTVYDKVRPKK